MMIENNGVVVKNEMVDHLKIYIYNQNCMKLKRMYVNLKIEHTK